MDNDKGYNDEDKKRHVVTHPLIRTNPVNGRKAIYAGAHASHVIGWRRQEGRSFIQWLNEFATQPQFCYSHAWRQGDLVIWDNRATLHRATAYRFFISIGLPCTVNAS